MVGAAAGVTCDTFTPREPPPPEENICRFSQQENPRFREPLAPEILRDNIKLAIECPRTEFYEQSLNSEPRPDIGNRAFQYVPDAEANALPPNPEEFWAAWNRDQELQFVLNVLEVPARAEIVLPDTTLEGVLVSTSMDIPLFEDTGELGTNDARYRVEYELTLLFRHQSAEFDVELTQTYCGIALWDLTGRDRNSWTLFKWEDLEPLAGTCTETMGVLRFLER
jgi:hypothetical protein